MARNASAQADETSDNRDPFLFDEDEYQNETPNRDIELGPTDLLGNGSTAAAKRSCNRLDAIEGTLHDMRDMMSQLFEKVGSNEECLQEIK